MMLFVGDAVVPIAMDLPSCSEAGGIRRGMEGQLYGDGWIARRGSCCPRPVGLFVSFRYALAEASITRRSTAAAPSARQYNALTTVPKRARVTATSATIG